MLEHKPGIGAGLALGEAGVIRGRGAVGVTRGLVVREERSEAWRWRRGAPLTRGRRQGG